MTTLHSTSAFTPSTLPRGGSRKFWLGCLGAIALLLGLAVTAHTPKNLPYTPRVANPAVIAPGTPVAMPASDEVMPDAPLPVDLYRFALNALLVPLIDDATPPRWTDIAMNFFCDLGTTVMIDGKPMVPGELVPAKAFKVRWDMSRCKPLGPQSVELSGGVELVVFHEDTGLSAMVIPDRLRVDSHLGRVLLRGPFAAETSLVTQVVQR